MKKSLEKLNLDLQSKIELWLTYKDAKPASLISIRLKSESDRIEKHKDEINILIKWLNKANLCFIQDAQKKELFYISKDQKKVNKLQKIMWKNDKRSTYLKGKYFGYPESAVKVYSDQIEACIKGKKTFKEVGLITWSDPKMKSFDKYWKWYIRYVPRRDSLLEDSFVAKKWADIVRADIPKIANLFEKELQKVQNYTCPFLICKH